jgi:hypothetical protein
MVTKIKQIVRQSIKHVKQHPFSTSIQASNCSVDALQKVANNLVYLFIEYQQTLFFWGLGVGEGGSIGTN